jgi:hypothetical protein
VINTQLRLVEITSTNGLQIGLITQGKYKTLVQNAKAALETPIVLYIITETVIAMT